LYYCCSYTTSSTYIF
nr:immunoglobulin light chain junction region [Macaca mulatta]MOV68245.1 immunoglobulin light chain junction region [Macaca mulatta]MOV70203.1 immunoglobulin light chain junction region [Macaca mulatta]MOV70972.1 immunoglobulin light chain junction region [Macaca mulatta]MOV71303.1 immunoglobulin light chain junction region [Macaca mulatta]